MSYPNKQKRRRREMFWYMCELCSVSTWEKGISLPGDYAGSRTLCHLCGDELMNNVLMNIRCHVILRRSKKNWEKQIVQDFLDNYPTNLNSRVYIKKMYSKYNYLPDFD